MAGDRAHGEPIRTSRAPARRSPAPACPLERCPPYGPASSPAGLSSWDGGSPAGVAMSFPVAGRGRSRQRHGPGQPSVAAETILAGMTGGCVTWRHGTEGRLPARFHAPRVRMADGPTQRIGTQGNPHMPGPAGWLVREGPRPGSSASDPWSRGRPALPRRNGPARRLVPATGSSASYDAASSCTILLCARRAIRSRGRPRDRLASETASTDNSAKASVGTSTTQGARST